MCVCVCTVCHILYTMCCVLYTMYCVPCTMCCILYVIYMCHVFCVLYTIWCMLCAMWCVLYAVYWVPCMPCARTVCHVVCAIDCVPCNNNNRTPLQHLSCPPKCLVHLAVTLTPCLGGFPQKCLVHLAVTCPLRGLVRLAVTCPLQGLVHLAVTCPLLPWWVPSEVFSSACCEEEWNWTGTRQAEKGTGRGKWPCLFSFGECTSGEVDVPCIYLHASREWL